MTEIVSAVYYISCSKQITSLYNKETIKKFTGTYLSNDMERIKLLSLLIKILTMTDTMRAHCTFRCTLYIYILHLKGTIQKNLIELVQK